MDNFQQSSTHTPQKLLSLFFLLIVGSEIVQGHSYPRDISIPGLGVLNGSYDTHSLVISFLGIPYAQAPTGKLRFQLPQRVSWNGTRDATTEPPGCIQHAPEMNATSEDCLYLNVYVPGNETDSTSNLSVMVWIHGGDFNTGFSNKNNVKALAQRGDVILVTLNYRLNIFGFLSSGDTTLPGNAGLHDQVMALTWVKANIKIFGGNPEEITIFGNSAGAVSIYVLLASTELTKGLFVRAIMQSGMVEPVTAPKVAFKTIANLTSCPHIHVDHGDHSYSTDKQIECMQNKTAAELLAVVTNQGAPVFGPVIDKVFLHSPIPEQLAAQKNGVPCLIGLNNNELVLKAGDSISDMDALKKRLGSLGGKSFSPMAVKLMLSKFLTSDLSGAYTDALNSRMLLFIQNLTMSVSGPKDVFLYYFTHHPSFTTPNDCTGARQSDELPFVFGSVLHKNFTATSDEEILGEEMTAIWSSFARDGVPKLPNGVTWPPYEKTKRSYVELNVNITAENVKERLREGDRIFWNEVIPQITEMKKDMKMNMTMAAASSSSKSIAWGMPEQSVQNLLMALLICLIFVTVICVTLMVILCKVQTIKLAATTNGIMGVSTHGGNINKAFTNDATKSRPESITAL